MVFVGFAALAIWIDSRYTEVFAELPLVLSATVSGGRSIAAAVASATITVAAIVFSITALSTQMAASQYSPRALSGFFEDPLQQWTIGVVVGTFTYSLLILAGMGDFLEPSTEATPSLAVTLTILFGVLSAIAIVGYINHSLKRMQIDSVVRRIADAAMRAVRKDLRDSDDPNLAESSPPHGESKAVSSRRSGWVVEIDTHALLERLPVGTAAKVGVHIGEAVSSGDQILTLWPDPGEDFDADHLLHRAIELSSKRSLETDAAFGIRQLVDIALRALSTGVNDPTTAVDVLHHLKIPIREVLTSDPPRRVFIGEGDRRVYLADMPSRSDYVHMAFSEIRIAAGTQISVMEALVEVLEDLKSELDNANLGARSAALDEELELTMAMARESGLSQRDLERTLGANRLAEQHDDAREAS